MKLEMIKGLESSLIIENVVSSISEDGFLADSYSKAFHALCDYVQYSNTIRKTLAEHCASARNDILYRSPQNIISFSGKRGSGKSSTMLSFSRVLSNPEKLKELCDCPKISGDHSPLKSKRFTVLDPIDPTTLEENQSILSVILSRLLFKAEEIWSQHTNFYGEFQDKESRKNELLVLARQCLNGINAIKSKKGIIGELSELQKVGDSSILKKNLYDFVELFFQFGNTEKCLSSGDHMLVIQIDDTDCQINQGYEVMEDIRKYLTIPNTVILMATDTKLLRQVLTQRYVVDFSGNLGRELVEIEQIRNLGEKYLAKLMPPSHVIHLPNVDEIIRDQADFIQLYYYDSKNFEYSEKNKQPKLNLLAPEEQGGYEKYDFQSVILRYIYKKTHIVFSSHDAYANNIIPTTLRGLAYLLSQLSAMKDVPEIDFNHDPFDVKYLAETLKDQALILEQNLNLFEEYFLHDWISAKLPQDKLKIMEKLINQVPDQRIPFTLKELVNHYGIQDSSNGNLNIYSQWDKNDTLTYAELDKLLRIIQGTAVDSLIETNKETKFRQMEDFYFIFAIRTLLSIKNNKDVLRIKRRTLNGRLESDETPIIFDYLKTKTSLPTGFYLDQVQLKGWKLVNDSTETDTGEDSNTHYFQSYLKDSQRCFNFTGGIIEWLTPEKADYDGLSLKELYAAQELAALVAANCDIQEVARKAVAREGRKAPQSSTDCLSDAVEFGLTLMQKAVSAINQGMLEMYDPSKIGGLVWKINEEMKERLNSIQGLQENPSKDCVNGPTPPTSPTEQTQASAYPRFELELPTINNPQRISPFRDELQKYQTEVKRYVDEQKKSLTCEIEELLRQLVSFEFKSESDTLSQNRDITNQSEFYGLLNKLYQELDKLFPNDIGDQK